MRTEPDGRESATRPAIVTAAPAMRPGSLRGDDVPAILPVGAIFVPNPTVTGARFRYMGEQREETLSA